jgi:hypothetical protein
MKKLVLAAMVLAAVVVPSPGQAQSPEQPATVQSSAQPDCGATITADVKLKQDMSCTGLALLIETDGVTVDLGGRTITVDTPGVCDLDVVPSSCAINAWGEGITIKNGTLRGGGFSGNAAIEGIRLENAESVALGGSITRSRFTDSPLRVAAGTSVYRNQFIRSPIDADTDFAAFGADFWLVDNRIEDSPTDGVRLHIRFSGPFLGAVAGNRMKGNAGAGLAVLFDNVGLTELAIADNRSLHNGGDGISVAQYDVAEDGEPTTATLSGNVANRNGGLGIRVSGDDLSHVVDGGGNIARHNGPQCAGIVCS